MSTTTVPPPPSLPSADFFKTTNVPAEVHSNERNNLMKDIQRGIKLKSINAVKIIPSQIQETDFSIRLLRSQNLPTNDTLQIIKPSILSKPKILPSGGTKIGKKESELSKDLNVSEQLTTSNANVSSSQSILGLSFQLRSQQPVRNAAEAMKYLLDNKFKDQINQRRSRIDPTSDDEENKSGKNIFDNET
uniref:WH2 domain-containing protein n=1 Tax=Panagrolaimus davidi TaxID=227884 RepID=A0A914PPC5_9BILA